jgi:hypothetical protein
LFAIKGGVREIERWGEGIKRENYKTGKTKAHILKHIERS